LVLEDFIGAQESEDISGRTGSIEITLRYAWGFVLLDSPNCSGKRLRAGKITLYLDVVIVL